MASITRTSRLQLSEAVSIATGSLWAHKLRSVMILAGVAIGVYPAWEVARLDPVEALRYE